MVLIIKLIFSLVTFGLGLCIMVFQQYFCYIVAFSFIGGGNRRKPTPAASH
jgi:hypothetical protein